MMRLTVGTTEIQLLLTVESRIWRQIRNQGKMMREARERGSFAFLAAASGMEFPFG